ncbi:hypothetical protein ES332_A10G037200v1 [Gossypium tomentosum]|uniref:Uncharacterized protein n=1 Tax=Gossypium tomentosum TaxID=34277 RepID=A0A5D2NKN8_GOSTO|nr:hypothetical protein ES332_A10G037200v1 [Gossypium tomentosum]
MAQNLDLGSVKQKPRVSLAPLPPRVQPPSAIRPPAPPYDASKLRTCKQMQKQQQNRDKKKEQIFVFFLFFFILLSATKAKEKKCNVHTEIKNKKSIQRKKRKQIHKKTEKSNTLKGASFIFIFFLFCFDSK